MHRGAYRLAEQATTAMEDAREKVSSFIKSDRSEEIIFTVLDELRGSKSFLIQLESADNPMRFSSIYDSEKKVVRFLDALISKSDC